MTNPARDKIVEQARSYLGVRWKHQGRSREAGIDCAGLVVRVGWDLGYIAENWDYRGYRREPDGKTLAAALSLLCYPKNISNWKPGDIVLLRDHAMRWPCHMGFLSDRGDGGQNLIHSWARLHRKTVEQRFDETWSNRLSGLYSFKGVD